MLPLVEFILDLPLFKVGQYCKTLVSLILFQFEEQFLDSTSPTPSDLLECVAHECPDLMRKGKTRIKQNQIYQLYDDGEPSGSVVECLT